MIRNVQPLFLKIFDRIHCSMHCLLLHDTCLACKRCCERSWDAALLKNTYTATQMADNKRMEFEFSDKNEGNGLISMYRCIGKIFLDYGKFCFTDIPKDYCI